MNLLFCVDGNNAVGSGHIMRCLALADEAKKQGCRTTFVCSTDDFSNIILRRGHELFVLNSDYRNLIADKYCPLIKNNKPSVVVIDSYYASQFFVEQIWECIHEVHGKVLLFDDTVTNAYKCDWLVNYNLYALEMKQEYSLLYREYECEPSCFLLGPRYAPLREEFQDLPNRKIKEKAKDVLILSGGTDAQHFLLGLLDNLTDYPDFRFHIVVTDLNVDKGVILDKASHYSNIDIHENVQKMSDLMSSVDVAVSAAGSTLYELWATQTPTILYTVADNQLLGGKEFQNKELMIGVGDIRTSNRKSFYQDLLYALVNLMSDFNKRQQMVLNMQRESIGQGCMNILRELA